MEKQANAHQEIKSVFPQCIHVPADSFLSTSSVLLRLKLREFVHTFILSSVRLLMGNNDVPPGLDKQLLNRTMLPWWPKLFQHLPYKKQDTWKHKIKVKKQIYILYLG